MSDMEVGTEISQKIRSAIKAKLVELGSYVDDELPDYIMVMVANKKSRAQMNGDLGLFLGTSTIAFTDWLHGLLEKLQTIRIEPEPPADKHEKSDDKVKTKEKKKDHKKSHKHKGKADTSHSGKKKDKKKDIESVASDNAAVVDNIGTKTTGKNSESPEETNVDCESQHEKEPVNDSSVSEDFEDVRQLLVTEAAEDELTNELETTEVEIIHARTVKTTAKPVAKSSQDVTTAAVSGRLSTAQKPERQNVPKVSEMLRKRRAALTSVVATTVSQKDEDEEYDPRNPAVASVVRVTARKSSIPPLLQANRVLLMKAMSEAERSVAVKKKTVIPKQASRDDSPSEVYSPKRKRDRSRDQDSPPPYIPSKKDTISRKSSGSQRLLSRNDARHMIKRDNDRQPASGSYRDVVQTAKRSPDSEQRFESSRSPERSKRQKEDDRHVQKVTSDRIDRESKNDKNTEEITSKKIVRGVKSDKNIRQVTSDRKGDKNIQITCHLVSDSRPSVSHVERKRQHSLSPEPKKPLHVTVYPLQNTKSTASRLGKIVVERNNSDGDERESGGTRESHAVISTSQRDAREDIVAKAARSKLKENLSQKNNSGPVISNVGKEAAQKQCEAAVISVQAAKISTRAKRNMSPDSRVVECDTQSNEDAKVEDDSRDHKEEVKVELISEKRRSSTHGLDEGAKGRSSDSFEDDDDDLSKMIDEDLCPELLDDTNGDDFNLDLDMDDDLSKVASTGDEPLASDVQDNITKDDNKRGTRFIVTLDGVDERHFHSEDKGSNFDKFKNPAPVVSAPAPAVVAPVVATSAQQMLPDPSLYLRLLGVPPSTMSQALLQQVQAASLTVPSKLTPPKIQPFSISLKDSDDEHDEKEAKTPAASEEYYHQAEGDVSAIKRAKMSERCKFWPACAAGSSCEYHHPTAHCKTFPNCKFGDKCLFIHPNCRFDSKCARPDCPYTHTSRRPALASGTHVIAIPKSHFVFSTVPPKNNFAGHSSQQGICRYFPNCHNINCVFMHPKPCKFGMACKSPTCPFFHPQVPAADKLKWQASSAQAKPEVLTVVPGSSKMEQIVDKPSPSTTSNLATVSSTSQ